MSDVRPTPEAAPEASRRADTFVAAAVRRGDVPRALASLPAGDALRLGATPRATIYRELVRATVTSAITTQMPRAAAALGPDPLARDVDAFIASDTFPTTRYLRDLPPAFLDFAITRWTQRGAPAFVADLARHEMLGFLVAAETDVVAEHVEELALDLPVVLAPWAKLARYAFAVHEIAAGEVPSPSATALVVYRDASFDIRHLDLSPLAALIYERLEAGSPLGDAIRSACAEASATFRDDELARFLADLSARGILLGSQPR